MAERRELTDAEWEGVRLAFPVGCQIQGRVERLAHFGVFIDVRGCEAPVLLLVPEMEEGTRALTEADYPQVATDVSATVIAHADHNKQVRVSRLPGRERAAQVELVTRVVDETRLALQELHARHPNDATFEQVSILEGHKEVMSELQVGELVCAIDHLLYMIHESTLSYPVADVRALHAILARLQWPNAYADMCPSWESA